MKKIAKLFGLIIILATIAFVVGFNLVGDLTNEENINPKKVIIPPKIAIIVIK